MHMCLICLHECVFCVLCLSTCASGTAGWPPTAAGATLTSFQGKDWIAGIEGCFQHYARRQLESTFM